MGLLWLERRGAPETVRRVEAAFREIGKTG